MFAVLYPPNLCYLDIIIFVVIQDDDGNRRIHRDSVYMKKETMTFLEDASLYGNGDVRWTPGR